MVRDKPKSHKPQDWRIIEAFKATNWTAVHELFGGQIQIWGCVKSNAFGSVFIVAGTALGAGMLVMPLATAGVGFITTMLLLLGLWGIMSYTALLLLEAYQYNDSNMGLSSLSYKYLGASGRLITSLAMPFLMYSLVAAYLAVVGRLLASR